MCFWASLKFSIDSSNMPPGNRFSASIPYFTFPSKEQSPYLDMDSVILPVIFHYKLSYWLSYVNLVWINLLLIWRQTTMKPDGMTD